MFLVLYVVQAHARWSLLRGSSVYLFGTGCAIVWVLHIRCRTTLQQRQCNEHSTVSPIFSMPLPGTCARVIPSLRPSCNVPIASLTCKAGHCLLPSTAFVAHRWPAHLPSATRSTGRPICIRRHARFLLPATVAQALHALSSTAHRCCANSTHYVKTPPRKLHTSDCRCKCSLGCPSSCARG